MAVDDTMAISSFVLRLSSFVPRPPSFVTYAPSIGLLAVLYSKVQRMLRRDGDAQAKLQALVDTYADLYISFAILEERIAGALPACEGLLLLRETTPPSSEAERPRRP